MLVGDGVGAMVVRFEGNGVGTSDGMYVGSDEMVGSCDGASDGKGVGYGW